VLPSCATSRGRSPIRNLGTRVAAVVPRLVSWTLTPANTTTQDALNPIIVLLNQILLC